jgi:hypothetical protein
MIELWKDISGYEGRYQVSNLGRVKSLKRIETRSDGRAHTVAESLLTPSPNIVSGHLRVNLAKDRKSKTVYIHRIVLEAFQGTCPIGQECCHADDDPSNNVISNLRWGTHKENTEDRRKNKKLIVGEAATGAKLTNEKVAEIKKRLALGVKNSVLVSEFNVSPAAISNIKLGHRWKHVSI